MKREMQVYRKHTITSLISLNPSKKHYLIHCPNGKFISKIKGISDVVVMGKAKATIDNILK